MPHAAKVGILYTDDAGNVWSVLQASDIATALGNVPVVGVTPRLPHKIKPRRVGLRAGNGGTSPSGAGTFTYAHHVYGGAAFAGITYGQTVTDDVATWTVIGLDDETNNGYTGA